MLTPVILSAEERAALAPAATLALEYLLHDRLSELARDRRSGDTALLLAIRATSYRNQLATLTGERGADELIELVSVGELGRAAVERAEDFAALANRAA